MKVFIKAISYYLPSGRLTNEEIEGFFPEWTAEKIATKIGIKERRIASSEQFASDIATQAAERLFQEHSIDKNIIDFLIVCTQSPDYLLPSTSCIVHENLHLRKNAGALDINQGCSGYVYGLGLVKGLVESKIAKNVLLVTVDTYSKFISPEDKGNRTIFGDAGAATLISTEGFAEIGAFEFGTDGAGQKNLIVENSGTKGLRVEPNNKATLYMNGQSIFKFASLRVPDLVANTLLKNNLSLHNVDLWVFHQANKYILNHLSEKIKIDKDKLYISMENTGNTVSSSIPIALKEAIDEYRIKQGNKVLLAGFGVGYSWSGTVLSFNKNL